MWDELADKIKAGDTRSVSRSISLVENRAAGYEKLMQKLEMHEVPVIGITGPPGAGKSTLADALVAEMVAADKKVAVICIDPSSPFTFGSLLGDRIRMNKWYQEPKVYIRSLSTRGSLGGLNPMVIEIVSLLKAAGFDMIMIETVGIGQSEIEIAGVADITLVVLVPEAGDDIQVMKAGLMEIADIFVVNKSDRPGAEIFAGNLIKNLPDGADTPVVSVTASQHTGVDHLYQTILERLHKNKSTGKKQWLLANKAYQLISQHRMKDIDPRQLQEEVAAAMRKETSFNLYRFIQPWLKKGGV